MNVAMRLFIPSSTEFSPYSMRSRKVFKEQAQRENGFTLIEILVVMGIIAALAGMVIIAINPAKQFAQARNTERRSDLSAILNAVGQRIADNKGVFGGTFAVNGTSYACPQLPSAPTVIASQGAADISCLTPTYITTQIPVDPSGGVWTGPLSYATGYTVATDASGRITVCAPNAANETAMSDAASICMTR